MSDLEDNEPSSDTALVRSLAAILNETGLTEIEMERGELKIRVVKKPAPVQQVMAAPQMAAPTASVPAASAAPSAPAETAPPAGDTVKSPMVGTIYLQSQPGAAPFIRVGDTVSEGQTLLLVEAMKTMNPIVAPRAGVIVELLVADSQPVEYGEPLVVLG